MNPETYLEIIEVANATGKLRKGINEVTKVLERGKAKIVVAAQDTSPKELIMHLPLLAKERECKYGEVPSKEELGAAAGLQRPTSAVAVVEEGNAKDLIKALGKEEKKAAEEKPKEAAKEEKAEKKEEAKEEKPAKEEKKEAPAKEEKKEEKPAKEDKKEEKAEKKE